MNIWQEKTETTLLSWNDPFLWIEQEQSSIVFTVYSEVNIYWNEIIVLVWSSLASSSSCSWKITGVNLRHAVRELQVSNLMTLTAIIWILEVSSVPLKRTCLTARCYIEEGCTGVARFTKTYNRNTKQWQPEVQSSSYLQLKSRSDTLQTDLRRWMCVRQVLHFIELMTPWPVGNTDEQRNINTLI